MHSDLVELKGCGFKFWLEWFLHLVFVSAGLDRFSGSKKSNKSWHLRLLKRGNSPKKKLSTPKLDSFKDQQSFCLKSRSLNFKSRWWWWLLLLLFNKILIHPFKRQVSHHLGDLALLSRIRGSSQGTSLREAGKWSGNSYGLAWFEWFLPLIFWRENLGNH